MSEQETAAESRELSPVQRALAERIAKRVSRNVRRGTDQELSVAKFTARMQCKASSVVPPWALALMLEFIMELIAKYLAERNKPAEPVVPPIVES